MPRVELEPTMPVLRRTKTVNVLDRAATVIGFESNSKMKVTEVKVINWHYIYIKHSLTEH
jgi:hypothetical protein